MNNMTDIVTVPITIQSKSHKQDRYYPDKFLKGYIKLRLRKSGRIDLYLTFSNSKRNYFVQIAKESMLNIIMYHLRIKPIYRDTKAARPWLKNIEEVKIDTNIQSDEDIFKAYGQALRHIEDLIPHLSDRGKATAQRQWDNLVAAQRRIDLVEKVVKAKGLKAADLEDPGFVPP